MKTVYEFFFDFYKSIQADFSNHSDVEMGIAFYLKTLQIYDVCENAEKIANMELARFKLMDKDTFETFFIKYEVRYEIERFVRESKILAINRKITGETISEESMQVKLNEFYNKVTELLDDERYAYWIEDTTNDIIYFLKYASGKVDYLMPSIFS